MFETDYTNCLKNSPPNLIKQQIPKTLHGPKEKNEFRQANGCKLAL